MSSVCTTYRGLNGLQMRKNKHGIEISPVAGTLTVLGPCTPITTTDNNYSVKNNNNNDNNSFARVSHYLVHFIKFYHSTKTWTSLISVLWRRTQPAHSPDDLYLNGEEQFNQTYSKWHSIINSQKLATNLWTSTLGNVPVRQPASYISNLMN